MKAVLYAAVTTRIVAELEAGAVPWVKPWSQTAGANVAANAVTGRPYSGSNVVLLWMAMSAHGYQVSRFLTFKQAVELGGNVRRGEHGHKVYFVKRLQVRDNGQTESDSDTEADNVRTATMLREYTVFNIAQCERLPPRVFEINPPKTRNADARDELADAFVACSGAKIIEGHGEAYYRPGTDEISLPRFEAFKSRDTFYCTEFHGLTHWTGHVSRLSRDLRNRFGDRHNAAEELIAELGAAFLCAEFDFDNDLRSAGYIASWIDLLKADKRAFFSAAAKAQAAADYLRGLAVAESMAA